MWDLEFIGKECSSEGHPSLQGTISDLIKISTCLAFQLHSSLFRSLLFCQLPEAPPTEEEEQEAWVNALLGRLFWDFLGEKYWSDLVSKKIQMKLSKIKVLFTTQETSQILHIS